MFLAAVTYGCHWVALAIPADAPSPASSIPAPVPSGRRPRPRPPSSPAADQLLADVAAIRSGAAGPECCGGCARQRVLQAVAALSALPEPQGHESPAAACKGWGELVRAAAAYHALGDAPPLLPRSPTPSRDRPEEIGSQR